MKDVHTEHCCKHRCKYGDNDCTVTTGKEKQSFDCEDCPDDLNIPRYGFVEHDATLMGDYEVSTEIVFEEKKDGEYVKFVDVQEYIATRLKSL